VNDHDPNGDRRKPPIALAHGGRADASSWHDVIERQQNEGFTGIAPPNRRPSRTGRSVMASNTSTLRSGPNRPRERVT
jgi:hypothetical protein